MGGGKNSCVLQLFFDGGSINTCKIQVFIDWRVKNSCETQLFFYKEGKNSCKIQLFIDGGTKIIDKCTDLKPKSVKSAPVGAPQNTKSGPEAMKLRNH